VSKKAGPNSSGKAIFIRGARQHNLKNLDLEIPVGKITVVTGPSGSGKSSLAFHTLYAEGQRRYVETFSPYVRQFFDRMDKPEVDRIDGIPPRYRNRTEKYDSHDPVYGWDPHRGQRLPQITLPKTRQRIPSQNRRGSSPRQPQVYSRMGHR
jgi:hypothetical protein